MQTTISKNRLSTITRMTATVFFAAAGTFGLQAQQSAGTSASLPTANASLPTVNLKTSLTAPLDLSLPDDLNYSSSVGAPELAAAERFNLSGREENQPPPRRRYGRPTTYNDSTHNPDGSNKWTFVGGGGFTLPLGNTHKYLTPSWNLQVGGGRNFNKTFGVLLQFDYANFGFQGSTLRNQQAFYNSFLDPADQISGLDGSSHVWSFTVNPIVNYYTSDTWGSYVIAGLGFYHKTANFTVPTVGVYCDPFYGFCYQYQANQSIDKYSSNAFGVNGGIGFTYKFSRFASQKFFAEARYVFVNNSQRTGYVTDPNSNNFYTPNSNRTTYIPVTFGIRW
jgi:hypothetical protein